VEQSRSQQADPQSPQQVGARRQIASEVAQSLPVMIDFFRTEVDLEVADHVSHDVPEESHARQRHDPLLADRRSVELDRPWIAAPGRRFLGSGH